MATICLVRHGETDWNLTGRIQGQTDTTLNATGREQARLAGGYLRQWPWDVIVTSPLRRAKESACIIASVLGMRSDAIREMPHFLERDFGEAEGLTSEERRKKYPDGIVPGLEPWERLRDRVICGLDLLVGDYPDQRVILVAHGGAINAALAVLSGGGIGTGKTRLHNASLSFIRFEDTQWNIESYNVTAHLASGFGIGGSQTP
ncbi:MAG: histidine phosphatase family protein [Limnochordia bacterium]|jgi:uncharacterized phosphatase